MNEWLTALPTGADETARSAIRPLAIGHVTRPSRWARFPAASVAALRQDRNSWNEAPFDASGPTHQVGLAVAATKSISVGREVILKHRLLNNKWFLIASLRS